MPRASSNPAGPADQEGYADCAGVRLHYTARGNGPLMLLLHGFPDDSRTWAALVPSLAERYLTVTADLRGYTLSDRPEGVDNYRFEKLAEDVLCLIDHFGRKSAILVGHDWGAAIVQIVAARFPQRVDRLVLLNMPHLSGLLREIAFNRRQQAASAYARLFQTWLPQGPFDLQILRRQFAGGRGLRHTIDVLRRSDRTALLNYYRANYPRPPYRFVEGVPIGNINTPAMIVFGMRDPYILSDCLNDNARWFTSGLSVLKVPHAGHWVHHDAPELVADSILQWLAAAHSALPE